MRQFIARFSFTERALGFSFIASAALLAGAHLFERVGGLIPCILCLDQREAHWTALAVAGAGLALARIFKSKLAAASAVGAAALVYAVSAGLAFFHIGVEYGYWPGPALCAAGGTVDLTDVAASLNQPSTGPSCEDVQWRFLGVSMAGYNLLVSAGLFALTLFAALQESRSARRFRRGGAA
ncbi:disulfide bond formation protein B [Hyphococcus flavus]|uniref:Disulfide bond formation protein B n=1 Tax=Hyphococcus flavus TaxID=1866326 RepID=A0AAE9ZLF5_9PROT|nr:disulfide bond formation protein B [Hyphococcus flavus]WDI32820.1 disulfide bond formation protein B [Hyphococcus flavus]